MSVRLVGELASRPNELFETTSPIQTAASYPQLRFMGNKHRLLPWIYSVLKDLDFTTALDAFSGSGCVSYLLKCMGKAVTTNDFLNFAYHFTNALVANKSKTISEGELTALLKLNRRRRHFISRTFDGIFFTPEENDFLDNTWSNLDSLSNPFQRSIALSALFRSCIKKQPRGVFTTITAGNLKYDDGRPDLRLSLRDHFIQSVRLMNSLVFDNGQANRSRRGDVFKIPKKHFDLVYMDPPYVPRSDDNCYIKRYHFLEGLSCYWDGQPVMESSIVRKIPKRFTPFSYRRTSIDAFRRLFEQFKDSIIVLSYSSNGYPDKEILIQLLEEVKGKDNVDVKTENHTYHFGSHAGVSDERKRVQEYLFIAK